MGWFLYQGAQMLFLLLSVPFYALRRGGRGLAHYWPTLSGRATATLNGKPSARRRLWIHAVSVGEVGVAATFARRLPPDHPLVITTITPTGQAYGKKLFAAKAFDGRDVIVAYCPFDFHLTVNRFVEHYRPMALVLTEGDYWPLTLSALSRNDLPVAVINGRVSERAFGRQRRIGRINRLFYAPIRAFGMQTDEDRRRLISLGAEPEQVHVTGNLKFDTEPPANRPEVEDAVLALAAGRPILVAGSTMDGEEEQVLDAFSHAGGGSEALLILVPRHPERWDGVAQNLEDSPLSFLRRSALNPGDPSAAEPAVKPDVLLLDSMGELAALYRLAHAAFIGGTLVPTGGHNPLEPALFAVPTVVGPSMFNFQEMADSFDNHNAWGRAEGSRELGEIWRRWLENPEDAKAVGERALDLLTRNQGAVNRSLDMVLPLLGPQHFIEPSA